MYASLSTVLKYIFITIDHKESMFVSKVCSIIIKTDIQKINSPNDATS